MSIRTTRLAIFTFLLFSGIYINNLSAQIIIQSNTPIEEMVQKILGEGVYIENVTYQGAAIARASFENGNTTDLGLDKGIILCTGDANDIPGPSGNCELSVILNLPGHPLLTAITSSLETCDGSILEFDFVPETDTLRFRYVFGSEAYNDGIFFSDVFGCFISGPNPEGGLYSNENIAIVPGTSNTSIQIGTINNGAVPCNWPPTGGPCINCEYFWDNSNGLSLEYDGFTVVLEAMALVEPCETYHVFLGIAESGWVGYADSGVFIEATDYQSPKIDITVVPDSSDTTYYLVEGCTEANIVFKLPSTDYTPVSAQFDFSGSTANQLAFPDGDFEEAIPTEIIFDEGVDSLAIHVAPVNDDIIEGDEILKIIVEYTLTCNPKYDTIEIVISDYVDMNTQTSPDTSICPGDDIELWVNTNYGVPPYNFVWEGLPFNDDTITVSPEVSSWYFVNVIDLCQDTVADSIYVFVDDPTISFSLGNDTTICTGDQITLQPLGGPFETYLWSTGDSSNSITVSQAGTYSLDVTTVCGASSDEITVGQWPYPDPDLGPDLTLCFGETAFLEATFGFLSYVWQDNSIQAFYSVENGGLYFVNVEDVNGCSGTDSVFVIMGNDVQLQDDSLDLCEGETINVQANSGFWNYEWSNGEQGIDNITVNQGGWYKITASYSYGCPSEDSLFVDEYTFPEALIEGDDMLCEGDTIWLIAPQGKYDYYWNGELTNSYLYMITQSGDYTLTLTNVCGEDSQMKTIQLNPLPLVDLGEDKLLFPGESVTLDAGQFQSYIWKDNPSLNQQFYVVAYEDINELDSIWVEVFDGFCKNTDNILIEVLKVEVPNVITPNGDGLNDKFKPGDGWTGINKHSIKVLNRWGEIIWESTDFASGWDAKRNGAYVAEGTYFWILEVYFGADNVKKIYKGTLTVLSSR